MQLILKSFHPREAKNKVPRVLDMSSSTKPLESQFPFLWSSSATETSKTVWSACSRVTPDCVALLTWGLVREVGQQAADDSLVANDQHVALPLQLHDHWLKTCHQIFVALAPRVPVRELVLVSGGKVVRVLLCYLPISHFLADALNTHKIFLKSPIPQQMVMGNNATCGQLHW